MFNIYYVINFSQKNASLKIKLKSFWYKNCCIHQFCNVFWIIVFSLKNVVFQLQSTITLNKKAFQMIIHNALDLLRNSSKLREKGIFSFCPKLGPNNGMENLGVMKLSTTNFSIFFKVYLKTELTLQVKNEFEPYLSFEFDFSFCGQNQLYCKQFLR